MNNKLRYILSVVIVMAFMLAVPFAVNAGVEPCAGTVVPDKAKGPGVLLDLVITEVNINEFMVNGQVICNGRIIAEGDLPLFGDFLDFVVGEDFADLEASDFQGLLISPTDLEVGFGAVCDYPEAPFDNYIVARVSSFEMVSNELKLRVVLLRVSTICVE